MHLGFILWAMGTAAVVRWAWRPGVGSWQVRWWRAVLALGYPLGLLLSTALAILGMGHHGTMLGWAVSPLGCRVSQLGLGLGLLVLLYGLFQVGWTAWHWRQYAWVELPQGSRARLVETPVPWAAQVGFWRAALVVSRGWLDQLSPAEQTIILAHEQAHAHYRDPLWFWLLGLARRLTRWLPRTEALWRELLLLREIRADRCALTQADPLTVAELLVKMSRHSALDAAYGQPLQASFSHPDELDRLEQRIDALLQPLPEGDKLSLARLGLGLAPMLLPLLAMILHR